VKPVSNDPNEIRRLNREAEARTNAANDVFETHQAAAANSSGLGSLVKADGEAFIPKPRSRAEENHSDVLKRILFIFAKLNPGIRYVQGMNEILAPLYYVFAHDDTAQAQAAPSSEPERKWTDDAEADSFFCFTIVMSEIRDRFIKSLDHSETGINAVIDSVQRLLAALDARVYEHLQALQIDARFYSFRWLTLLLSQEFELPDVLRLWDSLFADPQRFLFLNEFCCAMIVFIRERLLAGDFSDALKMLQHYPSDTDMQAVIHLAHQLRAKRIAAGL
jgi:hypothetical protein